MRAGPILALLAILALAPAGPASARVVCRLVEDATSGRVLRAEGDCDTRVTPASTFKVALAVMGFDSGVLVDETHPAWPFEPGYPDWRPDWRQTIDPTLWIRNSVVWYSQVLTRKLGMAKFQAYVDAFDYGNRDLTGDPVKHDGLTRAWLGSSLKISPREQAAFLRKLVLGRLPASERAMALARAVTRLDGATDGYEVHGKTGSSGATGWFVGWARKGEATLVFVQLEEVGPEDRDAPGPAVRARVLKDLPGLLQPSR